MATRLFMIFVLITGVWLIANAFTSAGSNHMLLTFKMVLGIAIVGLMEVSIARKKRKAPSRGVFIATWAVTVLTIILGIILPWGPLTQLFH